MRSAGVPARLDAGRWAMPGTSSNGLNAVHVKSEFYAAGIGWVPIEMSGAVSDKTGDPSLYFGRDTGQFLTMSVNTDYIIDAEQWGMKRLLALQGICCWGEGAGTMNGSKQQDAWIISPIGSTLASPGSAASMTASARF